MEELLIKYYKGYTTEEETMEVERWINASEKNRRIALQIQALDLAVDMVQVLPRLNMQKALAGTHRRMGRRKAGRYQVLYRGMQRIAAILFIPLVISWCDLYFNGTSETVGMVEMKTQPGMTASFALPDSTVVVLNSASSLQYPSEFRGGTREVTLTGEAFFSVKKDPGRKFVVNTLSGSKVMVHGTEFNVEAYLEDGVIQTTLVSGRISFSCIQNGKRGDLMILPGQKVIYDIDRERVELKKADIEVETSWKNGRLIFKDTPFGDILKRLGKRYDVTFIIKDEALKQHSFTGNFVERSLEHILERFRLSSNIRFRFIDDRNQPQDGEKQIIEVY